jgi:hypothetical protein
VVIHALGGGVSGGNWHIDTSQAGVVGEMVARFQERAEWCSHLVASGLRVCNLVLGSVYGRAHLVAPSRRGYWATLGNAIRAQGPSEFSHPDQRPGAGKV